MTQGSKMEDEHVFLGAILKGVPVTLVVNDGLSDSRYANDSGFSMPLEVTAAALSDEGSNKLSCTRYARDIGRSGLRAVAGAGGRRTAGRRHSPG